MKHYSKIALGLLLVSSVALTSCRQDNTVTPDPPMESIYARLGGSTMVPDPDNAGQMIEQGRLNFRKVVNSAIGLIAADANNNVSGNLGDYFKVLLAEVNAGNTTGFAELSDNLTSFFSYNTGGTNAVNTYKGDDMVTAHDPSKNSRIGKKVTAEDYTKFEGYVGKAANMNGVAADTQLYKDIVAVLESLRPQIIQK
ncbi:hypothetical protein SAMN05421847_2090 [Halpernia humi]|uniref:Group 1 truncated hemoglobin n=1 Tax=Halpernia humi TaxID=493375 RepID=A0A1H5ZM87_9FLAO|nr:hypothetical protein [Halpernia humi]SEG37321.1 hypothetical protein SAMN05421847_2090 [Halpernia humi]